MVIIRCPYCLATQDPKQADVYTCSSCHQKLPKSYLEAARKGSLVSLGTFGLQGHGKTAFLSNLFPLLDYLHKIAPGAFAQPLDDYTSKTIDEWSMMDQSGQINLPSTPLKDPKTLQTPLIVLLSNFPVAQSHILVAYDLAGEVLDKALSEPEYLKALHKVNTVWFIISLADLMKERRTGRSMRNLFSNYQQAMDQLGISIEGKNIIVVYTKADKLLRAIDDQDIPALPPAVRAYLEYDHYSLVKEQSKSTLRPLEKDDYFQRMREVSEELREYTSNEVMGGGAFLSMAEQYGAKVVFTINSAYGQEPPQAGETAVSRSRPLRLLDALLWAIEIEKQADQQQIREVALIVPSVLESAGLVKQETILRFYQALTSQGGHVATYHIGATDPVFAVGSAPDPLPSVQRLPLIGPILDHLKPGTVVVLLVNNLLPIDLADFAYSSWLKRLLVVTARREMFHGWLVHRALWQQDDDIERMVSEFLKRLTTR